MRRKYKVSSGEWVRRVEAENVEQAAILALQGPRPPRNLGMLIMIESKGGPSVFWDSTEALRRAGFDVEEGK